MAALLDEWRGRIQSLQQQRDQQAAQAERQRLLAAAAERRVVELQQELAEQERALGKLTGQAVVPPSNLDVERARLEALIARLRQELKRLSQQVETKDGAFAIVPFDGKSGTARRPILIECTEHGLTFVPEGVTIRPGDIDGFTERYNPLLIGSAALVQYWQQVNAANQSKDPAEQPYVLLVVRPSGTLAYYIAMRLLTTLRQPHGYELIDEDVKLRLPPVDPGAQAAVKAAVEGMLAERKGVISSVQGTGRFGAPNGTRDGGGFNRGSLSGGGAGLNEGEAGAAGAPGSSSGEPRSKFVMSDLEKGTEIRSRSWESIDNFEGQEHRQNRAKTGEREALPQDQLPPSPTNANRTPQRTGPSDAASTASAAGQDEGHAADNPRPQLSNDRPENGRGRKPARSIPYEELQRRRWGQFDPGATIGVEKTLTIQVEASRMLVGRSTIVPVPEGAKREDIFDLLLVAIDQQAQGWGKPGAGFFWVPSLKFVISPGGNQVYERIAPLVTRCGLRAETEFKLDADRPEAQP